MSDTGNLFKQITAPVDSLFKTLDSDKIISSVLSLFLVLYGGLAAPKLPNSIAKLFKNTIFRLLVLSLVVYMSSKDTSTSILIVVAFVISMQTLSYQETKKILKNKKNRGPSTVEKFSKCNQAFDVKRTDPYKIMQQTVGPATSCDHNTLRAHHNCYDEKEEESKKGGCSTCSSGVELQKPKRMIEGFSNCAGVNNPYTVAKNVRNTRINDLTSSKIDYVEPNDGEVHGNSEDKNTECSVGFAQFKKVSNCDNTKKNNNEKKTMKMDNKDLDQTKTEHDKPEDDKPEHDKPEDDKPEHDKPMNNNEPKNNSADKPSSQSTTPSSSSSPAPAPANIENFDNTCTTVDGAYTMVASDGLQLSSVTSNSEFEYAKLGLSNLGKELPEKRIGHPKFGASARKENIIKGVSDGGNLFSWNLKERGISNFGCSSIPKGLTNEGRYEETDDLVKAKVHTDGVEYGKNTFNNPSTMEWDAKADHRN